MGGAGEIRGATNKSSSRNDGLTKNKMAWVSQVHFSSLPSERSISSLTVVLLEA